MMIILRRLIILFAVVILSATTQAQSVHVFAPNSVLNEGKWVKIALNGKEDGVYEITYSQLSKMGFRNPENVGVYGFGGHLLDENFSTGHIDDVPELPVYHDRDAKRILFYGRGIISWRFDEKNKRFKHSQNHYATKACYFLHENNSTAKEMEIVENGANFDMEVSTYDAHLLHEQELINIGKTGRELYGESFANNHSQIISFDETLLAGTYTFTANFAALSSEASAFSVTSNSKSIGTATLRPSTSSYVYATDANISTEVTLDNDEAPTFRVTYTCASTVKTAYLNYITLEGKKNINLDSGKSYSMFRNIAARDYLLKYSLGLSSSNVAVWDVTDPTDVKRQVLTNDYSFVAQSKGLREYALVDCNGKNFSGITVIGEIKNQNLHATEPIDMVIVTAPAFKTYAQQLADFRSSNDGMSVMVVTPEEIYNEYSSGTADATAIRLFMKQMFGEHTRDGFLLIFGDGYYNNRRFENSQNYVVTYETSNSLVETSSTVCDDYFGFLDDNEGGNEDSEGRYIISQDVVDIAIGRIPVHSTDDAAAVVNKIIAYSQNIYYGGWKNRLTFLSDDDKISDSSSDSPNTHMRHNDQVIEVLQDKQDLKEFIYKKIYLPSYTMTTTASGTDYPDARKEFQEALQQGSLVVNYAGHGASNSITHEMLMNTSRAAMLNMKNLPLWVTASCDVSRWDDDEDSMGETLFFNHNGGAIALISTTRVVYAQQNLTLNLAIANNLFKRKANGTRYRLGEVLMLAKRSLGSDYNKINFCLLGDPAMYLSYPEYNMEITDVDYSDCITIKGRVLKPGTNETATDFHGLVFPTIYEAPDTVTADKGLWQEPMYKFTTRNKKIFSGRDVINNGEFQFSFVTPKDVSEFTDQALINLYACNEDNHEANGYYDKLIIRRPSSTATSDSIGPEIQKIFINTSEFKNGDIVGNTPYFFAEVYDQSGFNATGNSVGHDVTITIHSTTNNMLSDKQYNLNSYLTTYTGNPTMGNVRFSIPELDNGEYDITFKIWDSMNNSSRETVHIIVDETKPHYPVLVQAYPSPVEQGENVTFRIMHNLPESPTVVRLQIYTQTGVKILDTEAKTTAADIVYLKDDAMEITDIDTRLNADETSEFVGVSSLSWNASAAPGIYIYKVYLSSGNSSTTSNSKLLMIK